MIQQIGLGAQSRSSRVTVIYLHGFQSSSGSEKATIFSSYLTEQKPQWHFASPDLPFSPSQTQQEVAQLIDRLRSQQQKVCLIGSSMGGYYASYFSQVFDIPAVLINPVVEPFTLFEGILGTELENTYTGERHFFCQRDLDDLNILDKQPLDKVGKVFLLAEVEDEVLDYRLAEKKYKMCRKIIYPGGDHRFQHFEESLPDIIAFFEKDI